MKLVALLALLVSLIALSMKQTEPDVKPLSKEEAHIFLHNKWKMGFPHEHKE